MNIDHRQQFLFNESLKPLDILSVEKVCGQLNQIMVYGYEHCLYAHVQLALCSIFKKTFNYKIGGSKARQTLEGTEFSLIQYEGYPSPMKRQCKAGLVNMVFENYKRSIQGLPIIPILFVIDIKDNPFPLTSAVLTSRKNHMTNSELRRMYKLCSENEKIIKIAKLSVKFVRLNLENEVCHLEEIPPFWEASDWNVHWSQRRATSPKHRSEWRTELERLTKDFEQQQTCISE